MITLSDCLVRLKEIKDNSVDSIVTDPPYGLSFMGKKWDYDVPSQEIWEECLRVLKPGGHLLAFAGSRTYHRMAVRIEDAGFEIRDQIMWVYGSGFPKSLNIGKGVDKKLGNEREVVGENPNHRVRNNNMKEMLIANNPIMTKGTSEWEGWGTALKPAHEPIVMARKPFTGTVVDNVLEWGTGGINIDASRIETDEVITNHSRSSESAISKGKYGDSKEQETHQTKGQVLGRFPANIIFDEEAGKLLDEQSGRLKSGFMKSGTPRLMSDNPNSNAYGKWNPDTVANDTYGDSGGASRFFYCPKTSKKDRNEGLEHLEGKQIGTLNANSSDLENYGGSSLGASSLKGDHKPPNPKQNHHPTVKPTDLMLYLIRLVTPQGGTTLDPFMGSGSTGKAAARGQFEFIGIEREPEYFEIAQARIEHEIQKNINLFSQKSGSVQ